MSSTYLGTLLRTFNAFPDRAGEWSVISVSSEPGLWRSGVERRLHQLGALQRSRFQRGRFLQDEFWPYRAARAPRKDRYALPAKFWFPHADARTPLWEMKISAEQYDRTITLLWLPRPAGVWPQRF